MFFDLFINGLSCVFYGFIITIAVLVLILYFIRRKVKNGLLRSVPVLISTIVLFIVLFTNMSIMIGTIKMKGIANNTLAIIEQFQSVANTTDFNNFGESIKNGDYNGVIQQVGKSSGILDFQKLQELKNQLGDNWDLFKLYFDSSDMSTTMLFLSPVKTIERFNSKMNSIIWSNILWSLAFIILTIIVGMNNAKNFNKHQHSRSKYTTTIYRNHNRDDDF